MNGPMGPGAQQRIEVQFTLEDEVLIIDHLDDPPEDFGDAIARSLQADEFCNYAKTTAAPSDSQASNRKAGPACFIIGGALRVEKVDGNGDPLAGADFDIDADTDTHADA